ncbi:MAG: twitching motility protein PilT [Chloroflexi bacterium]|nr:twitching motility protein PilT [Chloroflexota bacterium]
MTFVLDASVALAWVFDDEASPAADHVLRRLEHESAIAPAHWPLEVANALRTAERRGRLQPTELPALRVMLEGLPIEIVPVELSTAIGALEMARTHDLTAYDATYLHLAYVRDLELATIDRCLRQACEASGVRLAVP